MDKNFLNLTKEKAKEIFQKFNDDQESLIKFEINKCNISKYSSTTLNSKDQLLIPIGYFIENLVLYLKDDYFKKFHLALGLNDSVFNEIFSEDEKTRTNNILEFFIKNKDAAELWKQNFLILWGNLETICKEYNKNLFLSIDNVLELNAHIYNSGLSIIIFLINYIDNIHISDSDSIHAIESAITKKEIINWDLIDKNIEIEKDFEKDVNFLNSLIDNLRKCRFSDILVIFKNHREEIINGIGTKANEKSLASEFAMWWKIKLTHPRELVGINKKIQELKLKRAMLKTGRDLSIGVGDLDSLKLELDKTIEEKKLLSTIIDKIDITKPETYPEWIEKIPGPESFVTFLDEKYKIKIDISPFGFESTINDYRDVKETKASLKERLRNIDDNIRINIIGQDQNIKPLTSVMKRWFIGINNKKPVGSFLFVGPTGVGKTETAKVLAKELFNNNLITLDMSEYQTSIDVSKIIGIAPGYVGYDEGGGILEKVKANPKSVILFDEIEKAHPKVYDLLLQLLDEGRLTDNKGNIVSFKECLIICTSNVMNDEIEEYQKKFLNGKEVLRKDIIDILYRSGSFRKEFLARFTDILKFKSLDNNTIEKIFYQKLDLEFKNFTNLKDFSRNIVINFSDLEKVKAKNFIISSMDKSLGAREIQRLIQEEITSTLLDKIVEAELSENTNDMEFNILYQNNKIEVIMEEIKKEQSELKLNENQTLIIGNGGIEYISTKNPGSFRNTIQLKNFEGLTPQEEFIKLYKASDSKADLLLDDEIGGFDEDKGNGIAFSLYELVFKLNSEHQDTDLDEFEEAFNYLRSSLDIPKFKMMSLGGREFELGDGDDSGAVEPDDMDDTLIVWFRFWEDGG